MVKKTVEMAAATAVQAAISATLVMRDRPDQRALLPKIAIPLWYIGGEEDDSIPLSSLKEQWALTPHAYFETLPKVGHMSMLEDISSCQDMLQRFIRTCYPKAIEGN